MAGVCSVSRPAVGGGSIPPWVGRTSEWVCGHPRSDDQPVTPGHVLVVPRHHEALLDDLDEELGAKVYRLAHRLSRALRRSGLRCEGVNLFLADGEAAFQEIPHVHLHVFPRYAGGSFGSTPSGGSTNETSSTPRQSRCALAYPCSTTSRPPQSMNKAATTARRLTKPTSFNGQSSRFHGAAAGVHRRPPGGAWRKTFHLPEGTYEYKVAINDSWTVSYGANGGGDNVTLTVPAGGADVTFTWDQMSHVVTHQVNP